jgi:hypothetical protein
MHLILSTESDGGRGLELFFFHYLHSLLSVGPLDTHAQPRSILPKAR